MASLLKHFRKPGCDKKLAELVEYVLQHKADSATYTLDHVGELLGKVKFSKEVESVQY